MLKTWQNTRHGKKSVYNSLHQRNKHTKEIKMFNKIEIVGFTIISTGLSVLLMWRISQIISVI